MKRTVVTIGVIAMMAPAISAAAEPTLEGTFSDWKVYSRAESGEKICYALAQPQTMLPTTVNHGDIYFMVANWKSGAANEQPSLLAGYTLKPSSPPTARVGSAKFPMYTAQNEGFIQENSEEKKLVKNMRAGSMMRVEAVSARGTATSYEFSLKGVTAALRKAQSSCQ